MSDQVKDREGAVHLSHCNQGEYEGSCKYGEENTCPALTPPHPPIEAIERLKEAAEKATPGEWKVGRHYLAGNISIESVADRGWIAQPLGGRGDEQHARDMAFIAQANPAFILSLISSYEERGRRLDAQAEEVERLKKAEAISQAARALWGSTEASLLAQIADATEKHERLKVKFSALSLDLAQAWSALNQAEVLADVADRIGQIARDLALGARIEEISAERDALQAALSTPKGKGEA